MPSGKGPTAALGFLKSRTRVGLRRSSRSLLPAGQITICAVGAYAFAQYVLGHNGPLFAATSSMIALGFSRDPRLRRVLEVGAGCTLGIVVGDLLLHWLGSGIWQAALVLFLSIMLARFLDGGNIFTTQLGLQSLLVVLLPVPAGGPFTRSIDAVVGGCFALAIAFLTPRDPRREPKNDLNRLLGQLAKVLRECAVALTDSDSTKAWHALIRARNCQVLVDSMRTSIRSSGEVTRLSPAYRRYQDEIEGLAKSLDYIDLALRNSRVFARRLTSAINNAALSDHGIQAISLVLIDTADAVEELATGLSDPQAAARSLHLQNARSTLSGIASGLHPQQMGIERLEGETVVMLFRPLMVDLLEAAGMDADDSRDALPQL
ncbi:FUSC family protein [Paenarthrobacter sp. Z7-10]|uniref:FUSC family protein n=1 Tax=Paenarthrobacter sp. Z7-10 TaxID=2787635 RepID=UPI0022A9E592|nr:FUSC family protein [Paenarthrobacter sp. Z7-10]MCZ2401981.1 FUSC family protein [Paenarthrobacter sp. Z7-10]